MSDDIAVDSVEPLATLHVGFLLMPEYTLSTFSNAVGMLRMANRLSGRELYRWSTYSLDGEPVVSSAGLEVKLNGDLKRAEEAKILLVCGGYNIKDYCTKQLLDSLRNFAKNKIPLGGLCTGSYVLATAGLLDGYRCTIHWENLASMREEFPKLQLSSSLFAINREKARR